MDTNEGRKVDVSTLQWHEDGGCPYCEALKGLHVLDVGNDPAGPDEGWLEAWEDGTLTGEFRPRLYGGQAFARWEGTREAGRMVPSNQPVGFVIRDADPAKTLDALNPKIQEICDVCGGKVNRWTSQRGRECRSCACDEEKCPLCGKGMLTQCQCDHTVEEPCLECGYPTRQRLGGGPYCGCLGEDFGGLEDSGGPGETRPAIRSAARSAARQLPGSELVSPSTLKLQGVTFDINRGYSLAWRFGRYAGSKTCKSLPHLVNSIRKLATDPEYRRQHRSK